MAVIQDGGNIVVPKDLHPSNTGLYPQEWLLVMEWRSDNDPIPVEVQLGVESFSSDPAIFVASNSFPPTAQCQRFLAGLTGPTLAQSMIDYPPLVLRWELGNGPNARTIYSDCKSGRFALGSQERVRLSACRYYTAAANFDTRIKAGMSRADGSGEWLTFSGLRTLLDASASIAVNVPPGAQWVEIYSDFAFLSIEQSLGLAWAYRDSRVTPGPPAYLPPSSPLPVLGPTITVQNGTDIADDVLLVFWVR